MIFVILDSIQNIQWQERHFKISHIGAKYALLLQPPAYPRWILPPAAKFLEKTFPLQFVNDAVVDEVVD
jgi:hypothetical protein